MRRYRPVGDGSLIQAGDLLEAALAELRALRERKDLAKMLPDAPRALSIAITDAETALLRLDKVARDLHASEIIERAESK